MDLREIKLAQLNRHDVLSNVAEPTFFTSSSNDVEQSSSPSQNNDENVRRTNINDDFTCETLGTAQHHKTLTNTTRDQQLNRLNNTHKPHKSAQQTTRQNLKASSNHHDDNQFNSSFGSLELQKQVVKHCFPANTNMDMERQSASSKSISISTSHCQDELTNTSENHNIHEMIPLNYEDSSWGDYDQEQKSTPATSTSTSCLSQQQVIQQTSSTYSVSTHSIASTASRVSTPGAYLMRGASVTGRAQLGMITPSKQTEKQQQQQMSCDSNQLLTANKYGFR